MTLDFDSIEKEEEQRTWDVLEEFVVDLDTPPPPSIDLGTVFQPSSNELLARLFMRFHRTNRTGVFLSHERLFNIAAEEMKPGRVKWETDIDPIAGIYLFVRIASKSVIKVGESGNMRNRFGIGHLRYGDQKTLSKLIDHCKSRGEDWPQCIEDQQITSLIFPMGKSCKEERCLIEKGLNTILVPETT